MLVRIIRQHFMRSTSTACGNFYSGCDIQDPVRGPDKVRGRPDAPTVGQPATRDGSSWRERVRWLKVLDDEHQPSVGHLKVLINFRRDTCMIRHHFYNLTAHASK